MRQVPMSLVVCLVLGGCGNAAVMSAPGGKALPLRTGLSARTAPTYGDRLVVKFKSGTSQGQMRAFQARYSLSAVREVGALGMGVLAMPAGRSLASTLGAIQGHPAVEYAEPDYVYQTPYRALKQTKRRTLGLRTDWGMTRIGLDKVRPVSGGSEQVVVAVIDTGVDLQHPDLRTNLVPGTSLVAGSTGPDDDNGHGTHVSGVIAGSGQAGYAGVAPHCKIMPIKALDREGKGDTGNIVAGLVWAINHGAKVVNMSLGGPGGSRALMDAVAYAASKDVVLVAAMGNDGANTQDYPAAYTGVIAVGATDSSDHRADFSNHGSWISLSAPGQDILSTFPTRPVYLTEQEGKDTDYETLDGTSMASPYVAGVAALVRSRFPALSAPEVKRRLERSAVDLGTPGYDPDFGYGRLDAARAVLGG